MTETSTITLNSAATLRHTRDTRFKTARLSLVWVFPADRVESPLTTLLCGIFRRGSESYPRLALLNRRLDELYGTTLTVRNYLHGDRHVVCYTADMAEQAFLLPADAHTDIPGGVTELLADMILRPLTDENGILRADNVEKEKQTLCDSIRAQRNDTRAFAGNRLREIMCKDEPYGISIDGTVEQVMAMTPEEVTYVLEAVSPVHSLSEAVGGDGSMTLESVISDKDNAIERLTDRIALGEAIASLDETSRRILHLRYIKELSQQQTGSILGLSQVKVSREEKKIMQKLKAAL